MRCLHFVQRLSELYLAQPYATVLTDAARLLCLLANFLWRDGAKDGLGLEIVRLVRSRK